MKLLPNLLLNVVVVVAAILVYDQVRSDGDAASFEPGPDTLDARALEQRLAALEEQRGPALHAQGPAPRLLERVDQMEARLQALATPSGRSSGADGTTNPEAGAGSTQPAATDKPTAQAIAAFRRLQAAAREWEKANRNHIHVDKALVGLGVALTETQREKLVEAYVAFQPRRSEIWAEAKQSGMATGGDVDWEAVVRDVSAVMTREFSAQIQGFVPAADADRIAGALHGMTK